MKYVLISLSESSKIDFSGVEKLGKTDHLIFVYVKGKKTLPSGVKASLEDAKAEIEYFEIGAASELWLAMSYLVGFHTASKHETIVITADKSKLPGRITKDAKVYSAFRSVAGGSAGSSATKSSAKKTSTAKKSTTVKKSTAKKSASTTKKTATKKTAAKKKQPDVSDIITSLSKGDTKSASKQLSDLASAFLKGKS